MYKQNKKILMTQPSNVASLEVYSLAASEPNKPRNCLWPADVNINASLHLVILFKSMAWNFKSPFFNMSMVERKVVSHTFSFL
jgi:hypothetical protein